MRIRVSQPLDPADYETDLETFVARTLVDVSGSESNPELLSDNIAEAFGRLIDALVEKNTLTPAEVCHIVSAYESIEWVEEDNR